MELVRKLKQLEAAGTPISVGIIGCGQMGSGLAHTINNIQGMQVHAIADIDPEKAIRTFLDMGFDKGNICVENRAGAAIDAIRAGKVVVTEGALLMTDLDPLDANVEATGVPNIRARVAMESILKKKRIIMLNVETDITIGTYLDRMARKNGALYTVASGDEPGVCKMLYEQAVLAGFEVVSIGKGKNNRLDHNATPESCMEEAASKDMSPKILASFKDGTKTMIEMAAVSNATGLLPDVPGMHGPKVEEEELLDVFVPRADGGIFSIRGTVDYSTGNIAPGVFVIVYSEDKRIRKDMEFITRAEGPYYLLMRPYHLCDLETPQSVAEAVLLNEVTVAADTMNSEVVAIAKQDLKAGDKVQGIGSADVFGRIFQYREAKVLGAVPIGLVEDGVVQRDIRKGEVITYDHLQVDETSYICHLRKEQDKMLEV